MGTTTQIETESAPKAIGPYSQGIAAGPYLFVSGQLPIDPAVGQLIDGDISAMAEQVFMNMKAIVEAAQAEMSNVVKVTVFLTDMRDFKKVNEVYAQHFGAPFPARSAIQVAALPLGAAVEAEAIVFIPNH